MIIIAKLKHIFLSILIISLTVCSTFLLNSMRDSSTFLVSESIPRIGYIVVLDAGHGGVDPGSIGKKTKVTEAKLNLSITKKVASLLNSSGIDTILTRSDDNGLYGIYSKDYKIKDMKARKEIIDKSNASLAVSIHMNSFINSSSRGAQVFYDEINEHSSALALCVQNAFKNDLPESNKGIAIGDYYILKCSPSVPTILCECGYLSNIEDEKLLVTEEYQDTVAYSIYKGIVSYLNS